MKKMYLGDLDNKSGMSFLFLSNLYDSHMNAISELLDHIIAHWFTVLAI